MFIVQFKTVSCVYKTMGYVKTYDTMHKTILLISLKALYTFDNTQKYFLAEKNKLNYLVTSNGELLLV